MRPSFSSTEMDSCESTLSCSSEYGCSGSLMSRTVSGARHHESTPIHQLQLSREAKLAKQGLKRRNRARWTREGDGCGTISKTSSASSVFSCHSCTTGVRIDHAHRRLPPLECGGADRFRSRMGEGRSREEKTRTTNYFSLLGLNHWL